LTDPYASVPLPGLSRLLEAGKPSKGTAVDTIVRRCAAAGGDAWLRLALSKAPSGELHSATAALLDHTVTAANRAAVHTASKQLVAEAQSDEEADRGRLWYLLVIAAGIVRDRTVLTNQAHATVAAAMLELAPDMPAPWNEVLAEAALEIDQCS
jgi:hypothetical protein